MGIECIVQNLKSIIPLKVLIKKLCFKDILTVKQKRILSKVSSIDSISDYDKFCDAISPFLNRNQLIIGDRYGEDSYYYGYVDAILNYAGLKRISIPPFVQFEHGVRFGYKSWNYDKSFLTYACQGPERVSEISDKDSDVPIFILGTYILYAEDYYSEDQFRKKKEELGRTLLVFPGHTFELDKDKRVATNLVDIVYNKFAKDFDTVMVCSYWNDIDDPVLQVYRDRGAKIVSAGFRGDSNFIKRLRTIIKLSDMAIGDDLGTNIGFCMALNKKYILNIIKYREDERAEKYVKQFKEAFSTDDGSFKAEQLSLQNELYTRFWGGNQYMLSQDQMRLLIKQIYKEYRRNFYSVILIRKALKKHVDSSCCSTCDYISKYHLFNRDKYNEN